MKPSSILSAEPSFFLLLLFLFSIHLSIALCYVAFTVLGVVLLADLWRRGFDIELPRFVWWFLPFIAATLLSTALSISPWISLRDNKELFVFLLLPIYIVVIDSPARLRKALTAALLSALVSSGAGLISAAVRGYALDRRLKGFTSHWMTFSGLLMMSLIFFAILLWLPGKWKKRFGLGIALLPITVALILSLTRSAWLGLAAALAFFLFSWRPKWIVPGLTAALILFMLLPGPVKDRFRSIVDPRDPSNRDRLFMVYTGAHIARDHPLTGVGANNVPFVYPRYMHPQAEHPNLHLHNNFLQILAERGIIGLLALLLAFAVILFDLVGVIRTSSSNPRKWLARASLAVFVGFLVAGLFEYNFGGSQIKFLLFFFLALPFTRAVLPSRRVA